MRDDHPWPYPNDEFPIDVGAVVMNSIIEGRRPALQVVHFESGIWGVADGVDAPTTRNMSATHLRHVLEADPTIAELAVMPPSCQADRDAVGDPWVISPHFYEPSLFDRLRAIIDILRFGESEAQRRFEERFGPR